MALLGNKYNFIDDDEQEDEVYTLPAVVRKNDEGINFKDGMDVHIYCRYSRNQICYV